MLQTNCHGQLKGESMNELNYASLEASKKLHDAGIILETDAVWEGKEGQTRLNLKANCPDGFPAPSMAEVLKELPNNTAFLKNKIYYASTGGKDNEYKEFISQNPTDALIDLLIWTRKEKV